MKKVLLGLLLAFVCVQVSHAQDLQLSFGDMVVFQGDVCKEDGDGNVIYELDEDGNPVLDDEGNPVCVKVKTDNGAVDPATGEITLIRQWTPVLGWEFSEPISSYAFLTLTFKEPLSLITGEWGSGSGIEVKTTKVGGSETYSGIDAGATEFAFKLTGEVERIYFQRVDWYGNPSEPVTFKLASATLIPPVPYDTIRLPLNIMAGTESWSNYSAVKYDKSTGIVTLNGWECTGWNFEEMNVPGFVDGFDTDKYVAFGVVHEPVTRLNDCAFQLKAVYDRGGDIYSSHLWDNDTYTELTFGKGEFVYRMGLNYGSWQSPDTNPNPFLLKIYDAFLLKKKQGSGLKKIVANTGPVDVYTVLGVKVRSKVEAANALTGLPKGIYIVDGKKVFVTKD